MKIKSIRKIEERLKKKMADLKTEESRGMFPTRRAILTGEVQSLKWVLNKGGYNRW